MSNDVISKLTDYIAANPRCTAGEAGTTTVVLRELERLGHIVDAGPRSTGKRGKPPREWVITGTEVGNGSGNPAITNAINVSANRAGSDRCRCDLHDGMSLADLTALGAGCTEHYYNNLSDGVCTRLDFIRREVNRSSNAGALDSLDDE